MNFGSTWGYALLCAEFPCKKIRSMLERFRDYQKRCKEVCSSAYDMLEKTYSFSYAISLLVKNSQTA